EQHPRSFAIRVRMFVAFQDNAGEPRLTGDHHPEGTVRFNDIHSFYGDLSKRAVSRRQEAGGYRDREDKRYGRGVERKKPRTAEEIAHRLSFLCALEPLFRTMGAGAGNNPIFAWVRAGLEPSSLGRRELSRKPPAENGCYPNRREKP